MTTQPTQSDNTDLDNGLVGDLYSIEVAHHYYVRGGLMSPPKGNRHACLLEGYWCPKNAIRHPQDIIKYIDRKLPSWQLSINIQSFREQDDLSYSAALSTKLTIFTYAMVVVRSFGKHYGKAHT